MLTKSRMVVVIVSLIALIQASSASTFQFDAERTGNFTDIGPYRSDLLWKANLTALVDGSPVVWGGKIYVSNWYGWGSWNPGLYSIDAETGEIVWVNGNITGASTPAVYGGTVFIGSLAGKLYAVNATTGQIIWEKQLEMNPEWWGITSSPLVYNGTLYITTFSDGKLHALDLNGNELWNITTGKRISQYSSPSAHSGMIFFAGNSSSNMLYAVDEGGNVIWTFPADSKIMNTPTVGNEMIFFATEKRLYGLSLDGNETWSVPFNGTISSPALAYGRVYIGSADGKLYCFNASTGEKLWEFSANGRIYNSPAVADGAVYFATNVPNGTVYAVDAMNGSLLWTHSLNPPEGAYYNIMSSPFIYNGNLYIGADDGNLYAFGKKQALWKGSVELSREKIEITLKDGGTAEVDGFSALAALWKAAMAGNFTVEIVNTSWGLYVDSIAGIKPEGLSGWMYWVNYPDEPSPSVGAGDYILKDGDELIFYFGYYNSTTWEPSSPEESQYIIKIHVRTAGEARIAELNISNGSRGSHATGYVDVQAMIDGWYAVVVSGTNENGDSIAGVSVVRLAAGEDARIPVLIPVPQQTQTGSYSLYAGIYRLEDYPERVIDIYGSVICEVR